MEMDAIGPVEGEAERPEVEEATVPLVVVPEEATASSPPTEEHCEEEQVERMPSPARQATPPERPEEAAMETAVSGTLGEAVADMETDESTAAADQSPAGQRSPAPEARGAEDPPQDSGAGDREAVESPRRSPQATAEDGAIGGLEAGEEYSTPRQGS